MPGEKFHVRTESRHRLAQHVTRPHAVIEEDHDPGAASKALPQITDLQAAAVEVEEEEALLDRLFHARHHWSISCPIAFSFRLVGPSLANTLRIETIDSKSWRSVSISTAARFTS